MTPRSIFDDFDNCPDCGGLTNHGHCEECAICEEFAACAFPAGCATEADSAKEAEFDTFLENGGWDDDAEDPDFADYLGL